MAARNWLMSVVFAAIAVFPVSESKAGTGKPSDDYDSSAADFKKSAVVIVDMWEQRASPGCNDTKEWVDALASDIAAFVSVARRAGATIVHAVSEGGDYYSTSKTYRSQRARVLGPALIPECRPSFTPGCANAEEDNGAGVKCGTPFCGGPAYTPPDPGCLAVGKSEHPVLEQQLAQNPIDVVIDERDPQGKMFQNFLNKKLISTVFYVGAALDQCVFSRPFGIRRMTEETENKKTVVVIRDLTDVAPTSYISAAETGRRCNARKAALKALRETFHVDSVTSRDLAKAIHHPLNEKLRRLPFESSCDTPNPPGKVRLLQ